MTTPKPIKRSDKLRTDLKAKHQEILKARRSYNFTTSGLLGEEEVMCYLADRGYDVMPSEDVEDIRYDIDLYLNGVPTSIKSQHAGLKHGDIYVEITTQNRNMAEWTPGRLKVMEWLVANYPAFRERRWDESWFPAWFLTGKAQQYLILQGKELRLYRKNALVDLMARRGFYKALGLSQKTLRDVQNGQDTICLFARRDLVDYEQVWRLS